MHRQGRSLLLLLLLPLLLLSSKSQLLLPQTWKLSSREKVTCPTGQNQDSSQTPPIQRPANALSSPPDCSMKLTASPPHRPRALGVHNGRRASLSGQRSGPPSWSHRNATLGLTRQSKSEHEEVRGTCILDAPAFPACGPLLEPSFVQSDWELRARVCHS